MGNSGSRRYWQQYTNFQYVKHDLIRNYLNGWLPKLALGQHRANRIIYVDTHAGRGRHMSGHLGSPLIALKTAIEHASFQKFTATELRFVFIEHDATNLRALRDELTEFEP